MTTKGSRWNHTDADFLQGLELEDFTSAPPDGSAPTWSQADEKLVWRVPGGSAPHALGGDQHTASTLAELNAKLSDASLDAAGTARPPTSHGHEPSECGADPDGAADAVATALGLHAGAGNPHTGSMPASAFSGLTRITVGTVAPVNPNLGDIWLDLN